MLHVLRGYGLFLLTTTALAVGASDSFGQAPQAAGQPPAQAEAPGGASTGGAAQDFGAVIVQQPNVAVPQPGLTASPTDVGDAINRARREARQGPRAAGAVVGTGVTAAVVAGEAGGAAIPEGLPGGITPGGVTGRDLGGGYMIPEQAVKTRSSVTRDAIDKQAPTRNPLQSIDLLPGVIQASPSNSGTANSEILLRGFRSERIGFTVEGVPINDSGSYRVFAPQWVDSENIAQISVSQGVPDLDSPHIGATGGVVNIYMRDPSETPGGYYGLTLGSNDLIRNFLRLETGQYEGWSAYVSASYTSTDHWIGSGEDERKHLDFKMKYEISPGNTIRFSAFLNEQFNNDYLSPTFAQFQSQPYSQWGVQPGSPLRFFQTTPGTGANAGTTIFNQSPGTQVDANGLSAAQGGAAPFDAAFRRIARSEEFQINPFRTAIISAPSNFTLTENLKFDTIPYYWYGFGNGGGNRAIFENQGFFQGNIRVRKDVNGDGDQNDTINFYNPLISDTDRPGIINKFTYETGNHQIVVGNWFEYAIQDQTGPYQFLNADGTVKDVYGGGNLLSAAGGNCFNRANAPVACPDGPIQLRDSRTTTITNVIFAGDTWKALDNLELIYGVKQAFVDREVENRLPGVEDGSLFDTATLPTVAARMKLDAENTIFASYNTTFRSAPNQVITAGILTDANGTPFPAESVDPETGDVFEIGHRYQGSLFATSVSAFYGVYDNFQFRTNFLDESGRSVPITLDAGGLKNYGINAEIGTRRINDFRFYASAELLKTELLDNLPTTVRSGASFFEEFVPTKGKELPGAPNYSFGVGVDYDNGRWFGNLTLKHVGSQYSTFLNDEKLDEFTRVDAVLGYRFDNIGFLKSPEIKVGLYNIFNTRDLVGVSGITNNAQAVTGVNGRAVPGSSPTYFLGEDFSALVTLSTGF